MDLQPTLRNERVLLQPLRCDDFEPLYALARDPNIWTQHPTPTRYQRPVFENYFAGAMASAGALRIQRSDDHSLLGCTRYYDLDLAQSEVKIGYTFLNCASWGQGLNAACKALMLDHAFRFVERVRFEVGLCNRRSQIAMTRLGARRLGEYDLAYQGEASHPNVVFEIARTDWID
ncbi:MAG: GNAT family N-acetyltransferase [Lysobacterales bacterium]